MPSDLTTLATEQVPLADASLLDWQLASLHPRGVGRVESRLYGLSMLSVPPHFYGLFLTKTRFSISIESSW
jgi:hypothetical protein